MLLGCLPKNVLPIAPQIHHVWNWAHCFYSRFLFLLISYSDPHHWHHTVTCCSGSKKLPSLTPLIPPLLPSRGAGSCHLGLQIGSQIRPASFMWVIVITSKGPLVSVYTVPRFNSWKYPTDHNLYLLPELLSLQQNKGHTSEHWKPSWWAGAVCLFYSFALATPACLVFLILSYL